MHPVGWHSLNVAAKFGGDARSAKAKPLEAKPTLGVAVGDVDGFNSPATAESSFKGGHDLFRPFQSMDALAEAPGKGLRRV